MKNSNTLFKIPVLILFVFLVSAFCFVGAARADVNYQHEITLNPGWNVVSTPRLVESHQFSAAETTDNFGHFPGSAADWQDVIKIANGRWPSAENEAAVNRAKTEFKKIYLREPNMNNPNDNAAVTIMAYGLRPANRNMDSEMAAISIFFSIYGHYPVSASQWDSVRAIAYSGAVR